MHIIDSLDYKDMDKCCLICCNVNTKMTWDDVAEEIVDLYDEDALIDLIPDQDNTEEPSEATGWQ